MRQMFEVLYMLVQQKKLMEKQTGETIKVPQFDHVGEFKDRFLQFGQNNNIGIHFTVRKHEMTNEMNCSLLEKIKYLLFNALLDKTF